MGRDPLSSLSWHNEEELPLRAELTFKYKISTLRHQPLNCKEEENSTASNIYAQCGQDSIPAGHQPGQCSLTACLGRASPSTWHPDGEKKKASQLRNTECSCCWISKLQQKQSILLYYWRASLGKTLELRITKTEPLIIPRAWCQLKNQQDRFPLFPRLACVATPDLHQSPLPPEVSSRAHSPLASNPSLPKRDYGPKGQGILNSASQSLLWFKRTSKQVNAWLRDNSGASVHRVTWGKENRAPLRAELQVKFRGFAKSLGRLSAPQALHDDK